MFNSIDCRVADPYFAVFRAGDSTEGSFCFDHRPPDWESGEMNFEVWDAESNAITAPLPFVDCCWIAAALNKQAESEP